MCLGMKILIIENDLNYAGLLENKIKELGHDVYGLTHLEGADKNIRENSPDLLIIDSQSFGIEDVITWLNKSLIPVETKVPFIVITDHGDEKEVVEIMKLGAFDFVLKDNHFFDLLPEIIKRVEIEIDIRKKLKKAEEKSHYITSFYEKLTQNAPDGIVILNDKLRLKFVSKSALRIFGYNEDDIVGLQTGDVTHPDDIPIARIALADLIETPDKIVRLEYRSKHKNGSYLWIESTFTNLLNDPHIEGIIVNFRDITDKKATMQFLQENRFLMNKLLLKSSLLIESSSDKEVNLQDIADLMREISGAKYVSLNLFDENDEDVYYTKAFSGIKGVAEISKKFLGFDLINKKWKKDTTRKSLSVQNSIVYYDSLIDLTNGRVPNAIVKLIIAHFNLGKVVIVSIKSERKLVGDFVLMFEMDTNFTNEHFAELFAHMVAQYFSRKKSERELARKMEEMLKFQRLTVDRELMMIELKKEINELRRKLGEGEKYHIVG